MQKIFIDSGFKNEVNARIRQQIREAGFERRLASHLDAVVEREIEMALPKTEEVRVSITVNVDETAFSKHTIVEVL